jgi:hypothetical protein
MELSVSLMLSPSTLMIRAVSVAMIPLVVVLPLVAVLPGVSAAVLITVGVAVIPGGTLPMPAVGAALGDVAPEIGLISTRRPVIPGQGAGSTQGHEQPRHQHYTPPFFQVHSPILPLEDFTSGICCLEDRGREKVKDHLGNCGNFLEGS